MEIEILDEQRLRYWCGRIHLPSESVNVLAQVASKTKQDEKSHQIFQSVYEKSVLQGQWERESDNFPIDPYIHEKFGEQDTLFYLVAYLAALPHAEQEYIHRGIDLAIFDSTMDDIRVWLTHCWDTYGKWMFNQFHWIWQHLSLDLFRLGRMQFALTGFDYGVTALKNKQSGEIVILADPQLPLRSDGYAHGAGDLPVTDEPWNPVFESLPDGWRGQVVTPFGYALPAVRFFEKSNWDQILKKDDTILDLHIPRKDRFDMEDCRDSLRQATAFFARFFPDRPYQASHCHTWFFSPQLQKILAPESNIVRFQREFYLFPFTGKLGFLWFYVFGEGVEGRASAPNKTSLQRAVLAWLDQGGEIFDLPGIMFHNADEWGSQPYMRNWEDDCLKRT